MFSKVTGFVVINEQEEDYPAGDLSSTLSGSLLLHGIPALTLELGGSHGIDEQNVSYGVDSISNILISLGMMETQKDLFRHPIPKMFQDRILHYSHQPVSSTSGIVRFSTEPGDMVQKGQKMARIYNVFGKLKETLVARHDSIVLGHADSAVALPGFPVMAFGYIK